MDSDNLNEFASLDLNLELKFIDTNGSKHKHLLVNKYILRYARVNVNGSVYYKCRNKDSATKKECGATVTLRNGLLSGGVSKKNLVHCQNCEPITEMDLDVKEFKKTMKEATVSKSTEPIQQLFEREQSKLVIKYGAEPLSSILPSFETMKSSL